MKNKEDKVLIRVHGSPDLPPLVYLPGVHGDWTLVASFRQALAGRVRFVELAYPRTTDWSLNDYAAGIEQALLANGITEGWLIGESFGSQPAWQMIGRSFQIVKNRDLGFRPLGLILAGGFVKHPWPWGARLLRVLTGLTPRFALRPALGAYAGYARFRHRRAPETLSNIYEFVTNRLHPDDPRAMQHRYTLIAESDFRPVARAAQLPIFHLTGFVDPIVPGGFVRRWLRRNCPGYRAGRMYWSADHNVLGTAPQKSADLTLTWMNQKCSG